MNHAEYQVKTVTPEIVFLVDLDLGNKSVTNDAEFVVREVHRRYGNKRIVYRDSSGDWSELLHHEGTFTRFSAYQGELPTI